MKINKLPSIFLTVFLFLTIKVGTPNTQSSAEMLGFYGEDEVQCDGSPNVEPDSNFQAVVPMETPILQPTEGDAVSFLLNSKSVDIYY